MDSPVEKKEDINKKLIDDKQSANESFFCVYFFQCMTSCCFLLYA